VIDATSTPATVSEAARIFERSESTIRTWADTGRIPSRRTANGQRIFDRAELARLAAAEKAASAK
jgi:DNA-binding transcriptional MerR regulator